MRNLSKHRVRPVAMLLAALCLLCGCSASALERTAPQTQEAEAQRAAPSATAPATSTETNAQSAATGAGATADAELTADGETALSGPYEVIRVVDGDTLVLDIGGVQERVRLIGVDTPESVHPDASRNVAYGEIASAFAKERLEGRWVGVELDAQERDRYGRVLAYLYLDGLMFNKILLEEGHAQVSTYPPNVRYVEDFIVLQQDARQRQAGLWAFSDAGAQQTASNPKNPERETMYIGNGSTRKFHRPGCRHAARISAQNRIEWQSRDEAGESGYEACKICNPL